MNHFSYYYCVPLSPRMQSWIVKENWDAGLVRWVFQAKSETSKNVTS